MPRNSQETQTYSFRNVREVPSRIQNSLWNVHVKLPSVWIINISDNSSLRVTFWQYEKYIEIQKSHLWKLQGSKK